MKIIAQQLRIASVVRGFLSSSRKAQGYSQIQNGQLTIFLIRDITLKTVLANRLSWKDNS